MTEDEDISKSVKTGQFPKETGTVGLRCIN